MLNKEEKIAQFDDFMRSKKFGIDTWMTLQLFKNNTHYILTTLKLYGVLIKRLDEGNIPNNLGPRDKVVVKQFIILDVIMKLEILVESTLVLIQALSKDRNSVPKFMTYYDTDIIRIAIDKIKNRRYNMEKILGLLKISQIPFLSREERKYLSSDYGELVKKMYKNLDTLAEFYEDFRLIYGKTKHGLTINPGLDLTYDPQHIQKNPQFEDSLLIGHDIKREKDLPQGYIIPPKKENPEEGEFYNKFFNTMTCVKFNNKLIGRITRLSSILAEIVPYLCDNHMTYAQNCGESYLPYFNYDGKIGIYFSNTNPTDEDSIKVRTEITKKIIPIMNVKNIDLNTVNSFNQPEMVNSLENNNVTNIWRPFPKAKNNRRLHLISTLFDSINDHICRKNKSIG